MTRRTLDVELPAPAKIESGVAFWCGGLVAAHPGRITVFWRRLPFTPDQIRNLAYNLLAAADHAEGITR